MESGGGERARSFGRVAAQYDRHRPGYPDALYDAVLDLVPGRRVLEAGAGTGRATVALARRGAEVVAVEPDPAMAAVARDRIATLGGRVVETPFEQYPAEPGKAAAEPADGFGPWTRRAFDWSTTYDAATYRGLIATHSNHLLLPDHRRERLLDGVHDAIAAHGDRLEYRYRSLLLTAPPR